MFELFQGLPESQSPPWKRKFLCFSSSFKTSRSSGFRVAFFHSLGRLLPVCAVAGRDAGVLPQRQSGAGGLQAGHEDGRGNAEGAVQAAAHPRHPRAGEQQRNPTARREELWVGGWVDVGVGLGGGQGVRAGTSGEGRRENKERKKKKG